MRYLKCTQSEVRHAIGIRHTLYEDSVEKKQISPNILVQRHLWYVWIDKRSINNLYIDYLLKL